MNPATLLIAEALIKYGPALAKALIAIFKKDNPTEADWNALFAVAEKSYDDYVAGK